MSQSASCGLKNENTGLDDSSSDCSKEGMMSVCWQCHQRQVKPKAMKDKFDLDGWDDEFSNQKILHYTINGHCSKCYKVQEPNCIILKEWLPGVESREVVPTEKVSCSSLHRSESHYKLYKKYGWSGP